MSDDPPEQNPPSERSGAPVPGGAAGALLRELALGEKSVNELVQATGLSQPNVSNHLSRLQKRNLVTCHRQGRRVIYRIASASLAHFVVSEVPSSHAEQASAEELAEAFLQAALSLKEEEAARVAGRALASGLTWKEMYLRIFVPTLVRVGELWEANTVSVASEHLITGIVLRLLHRLSLKLPAAPGADAPSALVGCVEGELHTIGGRMVADFLMAHGWRVWYLNGFLPLEHLLEAVHRHLPDAVVLCVSMEDAGESLRLTAERLSRWRGEQPLPLLIAGGRYFSEPREVPGLDLWGTDIEEVTQEMGRRIYAIRGRALEDASGWQG